MKKAIVVVLCFGLLVWSLMMWQWVMPVTAVPLLTATPSHTPTATATTFPTFWATVVITTSDTVLAVGEVVSVTTSLTIAPGCVYPVYDITLSQLGNDAPIFDPATVVMGPPAPMPQTITFTAVTTGAINFRAWIFGERNCGDYWNWAYVSGVSESVAVQTTTGNLPDLIINNITLNSGKPQCGTPPSDPGTLVWVQNVGNASAGQFIVEVNNTQQQVVNGLAAGEQTSALFWGLWGSVTAVADATNLIAESNEANNSFSIILPIPTQPPPCTPTPTPVSQQFLPVTIK